MNWLCRIIGHKWVTVRRYQVDGIRMDDLVVFGHCMRCGTKRPPTTATFMTSEKETDTLDFAKETGNGKS